VARLNHATTRADAIEQLVKLFVHIGKAEPKALKEFRNGVVQPLASTYVQHRSELSARSRAALLQLLADLNDARGESAFKLAFEAFAKGPARVPDKDTATELAAAFVAQGALNLDALASPMLEAFLKIKGRDLETFGYPNPQEKFFRALERSARKPWGARMLKLLQLVYQQISTKKVSNPEVAKKDRDLLFWQRGAYRVLAKLCDPTHLEVLLKWATKGKAVERLIVCMGKPARTAAIDMLAHTDGTSEQPIGNAHVAAIILERMGHPAGRQPLLAAIAKTKSLYARALLVSALVKMPLTSASIAEVKKSFELIARQPASEDRQLVRFARALRWLYDPAIVAWLLRQAGALRGAPGRSPKGAQRVFAGVAIEMMTLDQVALPKDFLGRIGGSDYELGEHALASEVLQTCGKRTVCYLQQVTKPENQAPKLSFKGVKAAYMIGVYGNDHDRDQLIGALSKVRNTSIRWAAIRAIKHLWPKGSSNPVMLQQQIDKLSAAQGLAEQPDDYKLRVQIHRDLSELARFVRARAQP